MALLAEGAEETSWLSLHTLPKHLLTLSTLTALLLGGEFLTKPKLQPISSKFSQFLEAGGCSTSWALPLPFGPDLGCCLPWLLPAQCLPNSAPWRSGPGYTRKFAFGCLPWHVGV